MKVIQPPIVLLAIVIAAGTITCKNSIEKKTKKEDLFKTDITKSATKELVFDKIVGTWQSENGTTFERWTKNDNGGYSAVVYSIKGKDTSWKEQANIYLEQSKWIFENTVKGQNGGKPIKFVSSILKPNTVQFSNAAHDFPTDIHYTVTDANTINAFIFGPHKNGGKDTVLFNYKRIN